MAWKRDAVLVGLGAIGGWFLGRRGEESSVGSAGELPPSGLVQVDDFVLEEDLTDDRLQLVWLGDVYVAEILYGSGTYSVLIFGEGHTYDERQENAEVRGGFTTQGKALEFLADALNAGG